ncbi:MAG TPA: response regulator transcription factor [Mucilaginibacter sp.]|nr:response regulator transcription factor [Mucilaginibacter sp.]
MAKNKQIIIYGIALAVLLFLLKWLETRYILLDQQLDIYLGIIAVLFTALGIWLALKIRKPKVETVIIEKKVVLATGPDFILNEDEVRRLNLSKRELEVLQLMADGLSNQEIAERLFVSLNTIKTHSAQIFEKMEVKRRTQAVDMAKRLSIIP